MKMCALQAGKTGSKKGGRSAMEDETLDVNGAARFLGVKPTTIRAWCLRKVLTYFKSGRCLRFRRVWLEEFIERRTVRPADHSKGQG